MKHVFLLFALFFALQLFAQSWEEVSKLYASDPDVEDRFSKSVAISGDYCIVGAHREDFDAGGNDSLSQVGAVYIFERDATGHWNEMQKLLASDMDSLNYFGKSVSIDGEHLLVGAAYRNEFDASGNLQIQAGVAYVFTRNEDGPDSGAYPLPNAGAVYVFENDQLSASTAVVEEPFVRLFPVPVRDHLQIVLPEDSSAHVALYDMQGSLLDEMTFSGSTSLPMVLYGQGMYVLRISYGNQLGVKCVIKY